MRFVLAVVAIGVTVLVFIGLFRFLRRRSNSRDFRLEDRQACQRRWQELKAMLEGSAAQWSVAVIEADKLFDRIMKSMALPGKDFGERLRFLSSSRPELRAVWPAHLVRNRLVHEAHYELDRRTAQRALQSFERGLLELGVL